MFKYRCIYYYKTQMMSDILYKYRHTSNLIFDQIPTKRLNKEYNNRVYTFFKPQILFIISWS